MKTKILILALLLLSCFSAQNVSAEEKVKEPIIGGLIRPCSNPLYSNIYAWNPVDYVTVEYLGVPYVIEFYTCYFPDFNIAIVVTYQHDDGIHAPVDNPNFTEINSIAITQIMDEANNKLGRPNWGVVYFHLGSCTVRFYATAPDPAINWGKLKLTASVLSAMPESRFTAINRLLDWTTGEPILKIVNSFRNCEGTTCCRAKYTPTYDREDNVIKLKRDELITSSTNCAGYNWDIPGICAANCQNFFSIWQKPTANNGMTITPNPSNGFVNVAIDATYNGTCTVVVSEMSGNILITLYPTFNNGQVQLDLSSLTNGTYIISIYNGIELISSEQVIIFR